MCVRFLIIGLTGALLATSFSLAAPVDTTFVLDEQQSSLTIEASTRVGFLVSDSDTQQLSGTLETTLDFGTASGLPPTADFTVQSAELSALGSFELTLGFPPALGVEVLFEGAKAEILTPNPPATLTSLPTGLVRYQFDGAEFEIALVEGIITASGYVDQTRDLSESPVTGTPEPETFGTLTFLDSTAVGFLTRVEAQLLLPIALTQTADFDGQEVTLEVTGNLAAYGSFFVNLNGLLADLDIDGDVDGGDFQMIQRDATSLISAWHLQYGMSQPAATASLTVPEPTTAMLICASSALMVMGVRRHRPSR